MENKNEGYQILVSSFHSDSYFLNKIFVAFALSGSWLYHMLVFVS